MSEFIVNVNEMDFEYEVLNFSFNVPVVVEFWAAWSRPCKQLAPIMEKLTLESNGNFRLARVNVDENPTLAMRYGVYSVPTVKAISQGQVVAEFAELQPEYRIRTFLQRIVPPSPMSLAIKKANSLLNDNNWLEAETILKEILEKTPGQSAALLGLAKASLGQGKANEALEIIGSFPASREFSNAQKLRSYAHTLLLYQTNHLTLETDLDAAYHNSIRLAERGNIPAALDGMLDILKQKKSFRNDEAHQVIIGLLELLGDENPLTRQYRSELASVLF